MGFSNPILGGGGGLVYPSIHSPNFVTGVSGWTINKDGSAEFDDLTLRGTFEGTDYEINSSGVFFYSSAPAAGNLIFSTAGAAGTDQYGNAYVQGVASYALISGTYYALTNSFLASVPALIWLTAPGYAGPWSIASNIWQQTTTGDLLLSASSGAIVADQSTLVATNPASPPAAEAWHSLSLAAGWSTSAGDPVPSYRLLPDGNVQIVGLATHTAFSTATQLSATGALPAAYRPSTTQRLAGAATTGSAGIEITTAGTVTALPSGSVSNASFNGTYPVNL